MIRHLSFIRLFLLTVFYIICFLYGVIWSRFCTRLMIFAWEEIYWMQIQMADIETLVLSHPAAVST